MIAVDTSALMAIVLHEKEGPSCMAALEADDEILISAGTLAETLIVAQSRNCVADVRRLIDGIGLEVMPVTATSARLAAEAYARWGKGARRAGLNFGDCFAYAVAKESSCPLLYVGRDFAKTDLKGAL